MTDLIKRDDAPEQIFASQGDDGWRWPRASKYPEQGPHQNIKYIRADIIAPAAIREAALQARIEELEKQCSVYARSDRFLVEEIKELEAKLETALEMLRSFVDQAQHARFVLRELEGEE